MDNTLTIIIPAYNAKETINKTLSSIAIQRTKYFFEVIIVNDNSDYDYNKYINSYSNFINIKEIKLSKNLGPGLARQKGIDNSKGKYIIFIDSDDYLYSPYSINMLIEYIKEKNSDIVISDFIYERDNKREIKSKNNVWLHGKIYKRDFLEKYNIKFNSTRQNEDNGFNRLIILLKPKIDYLFETTYVYQENSNSITRKDNRLYKFTGLEGYANNMEWALSEALKRGVLRKDIEYQAIHVIVSTYFYYQELYNDYDVTQIFKWFRGIYNGYYPKKSNYNIDEILKIYKKEFDIYQNIISYDDYLKKMEEYND